MNRPPWKDFRLLVAMARPEYARLAGILALVSFGASLRAPIPFLTVRLIDRTIPQKDFSGLLRLSGLIIAMSVVFILADALRGYLTVLVSRSTHTHIQLALLKHVQSLPLAYFQEHDTGHVLSRFTDDAAVMSSLLTETLLAILNGVIVFSIGIAATLIINWRLALVSYILLPLFVLAHLRHNARLRECAYEAQREKANTTKVIHELLAGITSIKVDARYKWMLYTAARRLHASMRADVHAFITGTRITTVISFIGALGPLVVLSYGGYEIMQGKLTLGQMIAFNAVLAYLYSPCQSIASSYVLAQRSLASLGRVAEVMAIAPEPGSRKVLAAQPGSRITRGNIAFDHVWLTYGDKPPALLDVSFKVPASSIVAVLGESGAGKSSLMRLLLRLHDPASGSIYIDDMPIQEFDVKALREQIGIVSQDTYLFDGSILDNIRFGRYDATAADAIRAAEAAMAHHFIETLPNGYQTRVGRVGTQLSEGQRQRIALARAILKNPKILILDEATSAIDSCSEELIWDVLREFIPGRTTFIISHRLSSVVHADFAMLMQAGRLVAVGSYSEIARDTRYRQLYEAQMSAELVKEAVC